MGELRWIKMSLFLILLLQFRAVTGQDSSITVRDEDDVTLSCKNTIKGQDTCDSTTWIYSTSENSPVVELIKLGQIGEKAKTKSDRLSVTADCSLVIKKVTVEDAGRYTCRQYDRSGQQQGPDARVHLSVVSIDEKKDADDKVTLTCAMWTYGQCQGSVEWLFEGSRDDFRDVGMLGFPCRVSVTFTASSRAQKSKYSELFKCKVTERYGGGTVLCNPAPQSSCEKQAVTGQDSSITVRDEDDVTLSCKNAIKGQDRCDSTTWIYSRLERSQVVELIKLGQIGEKAKAKSDRLSVTADCSLVIKKVTFHDVGRYTCRQFDTSGQQQGPDARVHLSVVSIKEQKDADDKVTLTCAMGTYGQCEGIVEWLFEGSRDDFTDVGMSGVPCRVSVTFTASSRAQKSKYSEIFKCKVTERYGGGTVLCNPAPQSSCEKQGSTTRVENKTSDGPTKLPACADCSALIYIMLVMRVAELVLITVVTVLLFRARAGNQRPPDDHTVSYSVRSRTARRSGPAASQMDHGEDDDVNYENFGENSASV
ncbi:uncharacterized protein LOC133997927 isoform X1 [Scomber scombrus]|uniref:uncharacterized protein LOC133997927 isoform X1 n=1 Tax=Scomber scombrus TaxID=13677 RepID=UPI002DDA8397|nr:uncharacterized protein LOC133997927 isoform X1 [Scomber scombrus]